MALDKALEILQGLAIGEMAKGGFPVKGEPKVGLALGTVAMVINGAKRLDVRACKEFLDNEIKSTDRNEAAVSLRVFLEFLPGKEKI